LENYAIVETGGKQYLVEPGDVIKVEKLDCEPGDSVKLDKVLFVNEKGKPKVGMPFVDGASVTAEAMEQGRSPKKIVFKYKPKVRYRIKKGHRQYFTELKINSINKD
tara:strand:- start:504 stop:824 length:321 start_codon:yes stop_codon:yes gene_type:complete